MPDGPPWIRSIVEEDIGQLHQRPQSYHVTLDENEHYELVCTGNRPPGCKNELCIKILKPKGMGATECGSWNDLYPEHSGPWPASRFDNEDIYFHAEWKDHPDPKAQWRYCVRVGMQRDSSPQGNWGVMTFGNGTSTVEVRLTRRTPPMQETLARIPMGDAY